MKEAKQLDDEEFQLPPVGELPTLESILKEDGLDLAYPMPPQPKIHGSKRETEELLFSNECEDNISQPSTCARKNKTLHLHQLCHICA
ncbi:hypothetical protein O3P69_020707 [Scylla paramamosain]|uniref:Uncharacterized protein n=1 Tax=Scylla paramamosain TaxID=85552 RepID=A0AAW0TNK5_SCYPA